MVRSRDAGRWAVTVAVAVAVVFPWPVVATELNPAYGFHGDPRYGVLSDPEKVASFLLSDDAEMTERFGGAAVVATGPFLTAKQRKTLRDIVRTPGTYRFGQSKRCKFHPDLGLRFTQGTETVDVVFCFSCDEWRFHDTAHPDGETEDFDPARPKLLRIARELFPKHAAFKKYPLRRR